MPSGKRAYISLSTGKKRVRKPPKERAEKKTPSMMLLIFGRARRHWLTNALAETMGIIETRLRMCWHLKLTDDFIAGRLHRQAA